MADPYIGEIRMFAGTYAPYGWALCNGQLMQVNQYQALFAILGNYYGGTYPTTFALPNLVGTIPMQPAAATGIGQKSGSAQVTISPTNLPLHNHGVIDSGHTHQVSVPPHTHPFTLPSHTHEVTLSLGDSSTGGTVPNFDPSYLDSGSIGSAQPVTSAPNAATSGTTDPNSATASAASAPATTGISILPGGGVATPSPLNIMPPSLAINFIIALTGIYPVRD